MRPYAVNAAAVIRNGVLVVWALTRRTVVSALIGFAWMPYYPVWGIVIVAIAVTVVWALTVHGRDIAS